jgi:hypothetical protein
MLTIRNGIAAYQIEDSIWNSVTSCLGFEKTIAMYEIFLGKE